MAKYWEDWSGSTIGAFPTGWTPRWHATDSASIAKVQTDAAGPAGRCLLLTPGSTDRRLFSFNASDGDANLNNCRARMLFESNIAVSAALSGMLGLLVKGAGTSTSETGVAGAMGRSNAAGAPLYTYIANYTNASGITTNESANGNVARNTRYWFGMDVDGNNITFNVWAENNLVTPIETVNTTFAQSDGWIGIWTFSTNATTKVYAFSVATGADDAIYSAPDVVPDTTAPVLTLPTGTTTGATTASGTVTTDEANGTLYAVVTASATPPSAADIRAGTGAVYSTSQAVSSTGVQNVVATGLTSETTYYWHFLHDDAAANASNIVTSASFTTNAVLTIPTLSAPGVTDITTTSVRPQVTLTF